jgi:hypothetical protein
MLCVQLGLVVFARSFSQPNGEKASRKKARSGAALRSYLMPRALFAFNYLTDVRLLNFVALARHSRPAYAAQFLIPSTVGMVFAYPPDAEAYGAVPIHYSVSGVRTGEDLSSLRKSCWAR